MSDEPTGLKDQSTETTNDTDALGNLKAEMNRKLSNQEEALSRLQQQNQQLLEQLQMQATVNTSKSDDTGNKSLSDLMYEDPEQYASVIEKRAEEKILKRIEAQQAADNKRNQILAQIGSEFPEVNDPNSDLTKRAVEIHQKMSQDDRNNPVSLKIATLEAAAELGVLPRSRRKDSDTDSFTMGSKSAPKRSEGAVSEKDEEQTLQIAQLLGINVNDPKQKEMLKKAQSRKTWSKYR